MRPRERAKLAAAGALLALPPAFLAGSGAMLLRAFGGRAADARPWTPLAFWRRAKASGSPRAKAAVLALTALPWAGAGALGWALWRERKSRPLHGDARFATRAEVRSAGLLPKRPGPTAVLVGKFGGDFLAFEGSRFALLAAPTRSGKGVGIVIPNCLAYGESLAVLDIKEENFELTSRCRKEILGQEVFLFSPYARDGRTHRWNPLDAVSSDPADRIGDIDAIAASLYSGGSDKDRFWSENAKCLFRGLCLMVLETPGIPHTLGEILRQASGKGTTLPKHFAAMKEKAEREGRPYSAACTESLNRVLQNSENTLSGIVATFTVPMSAFQDPRADAATAETSPGLDLAAVRKKPMTVYLGIPPDRLSQARVIVNLFFDQLLSLNTRRLPEQEPAAKHQCLLVLDEFASVGRIPMISQAVSYMAGYGMRLLTIVQNRSQLESAYGKADAVTLAANHALQVIFAPSPAVLADARDTSEMLGYGTVKAVSRSRSTGARGGGSKSESEQRRALLLPQEVRELGAGREIVALENAKPVLAEKIRYFEEPFFQKRLLGSVRDEIPTVDAAAYLRSLEAMEKREAEARGSRPPKEKHRLAVAISREDGSFDAEASLEASGRSAAGLEPAPEPGS